uniref:Uncharacterized protein n=1 Tax=Arion vulgaris TaxID=1028688 RepID=A0A0B7AKF8_9EUPU
MLSLEGNIKCNFDPEIDPLEPLLQADKDCPSSLRSQASLLGPSDPMLEN